MRLLSAASSFFLSDAAHSTLHIHHVNDVHSRLESIKVEVDIDRVKTCGVPVGDADKVELGLGGMPSTISVFKKLKENVPKNNYTGSININAGDFRTGAVYYLKTYKTSDVDAMLACGHDIAVLGNHEFDSGDESLATNLTALLNRTTELKACHGEDTYIPKAPKLLSANLRFENDSTSPLKTMQDNNQTQDYWIKDHGGNLGEIAYIGLTVSGKTMRDSQPWKGTLIEDEEESLKATLAEIKEKHPSAVNKIVLVAHYGYEETIELVKKFPEIDVAISGDSHTPLGREHDFKAFGDAFGYGKPKGPYPIMVNRSDNTSSPGCVVQAWAYGKVVGNLTATFDKDGNITSCVGNPVIGINKGNLFATSESYAWRPVEMNDTQYKCVFSAWDETKTYKNDNFTLRGEIVLPVKEDCMFRKYVDDLNDKHGLLKSIGCVEGDLKKERIPADNRLDNVTDNVTLFSPLAHVVAKALAEQAEKYPSKIVHRHPRVSIINAGMVRDHMQAGGFNYFDLGNVLPFGKTVYEVIVTGAMLKDVLNDAVVEACGSTGAFPYAYRLRYAVFMAAKGDNCSTSNATDIQWKNGSEWKRVDDSETFALVITSYMKGGKNGFDELADLNGTDTGITTLTALYNHVEGETLPGLQDDPYSNCEFLKSYDYSITTFTRNNRTYSMNRSGCPTTIPASNRKCPSTSTTTESGYSTTFWVFIILAIVVAVIGLSVLGYYFVVKFALVEKPDEDAAV